MAHNRNITWKILRLQLATLLFAMCAVPAQSQLPADPGRPEYSAELVMPVLANTGHELHGLLKTIVPRMTALEAACGTIVATNGNGHGVAFSAFHILGNRRPWDLANPKDLQLSTVRFGGYTIDEVNNQVPLAGFALGEDGLVQIPTILIHQPAVEVPGNILSGPDMNGIRPESDFFFALVAGDPNGHWLLPQFPPEDLIRDVVAGERVILVGFPGENGGQLSFSTGIVDSDDAAFKLVADTSGAKMPYKPGVEFLARAYVSPGFSGGGVFGYDGKFVGVISRGAPNAPIPYTRFLSANFLLSKVREVMTSDQGDTFRNFIGVSLFHSSKNKSH